MSRSLRLFAVCLVLLSLACWQFIGAQSPGARTERVVPGVSAPFTLHLLPSPSPAISSSLSVVNSLSGRLAYVPTILHRNGDFQSSLRICKLRSAPGEVSEMVYRVDKPEDRQTDEFNTRILYDPQFSPDGRYILFKFGHAMSRHDGYQLYVLDTSDEHLWLVSDLPVCYAFTSWSPDGRYIAFIAGGDSDGYVYDIGGYFGPLELHVTDWRAKKDYLVTSSDTVRGPFSWLSPHTLLYGAMSQKGQEQIGKLEEREYAQMQHPPTGSAKSPPMLYGSKAKKRQWEPRPDVFEYVPGAKRPVMLFRDGYLPVASPDGKQIAFFGSEHIDRPSPLRTGWEDDPQGSSVCVADLNGSPRVALNREGGRYPRIAWLPDGKHLVTLTQTQPTPKARAEVRVWDITTRRFRTVAALSAEDYKEMPTSVTEPEFRPLGMNKRSDTLFVLINSFTGQDPEGYLTSKGVVESVDVLNGKVTVIAQAIDASGLDWYDESAPVASTPPARSGP